MGIASKNSLPKKLLDFSLFPKSFLSIFTCLLLILLFLEFLFKNFLFHELYSLCKLNFGNFFDVSINVLAKLPSPGPSSTIFNIFGLSNFPSKKLSRLKLFQKKILEICGAVIKSPFIPIGFLVE